MKHQEMLHQKKWDIIIVGGGITGAGIFREATKEGWNCLLLEQKDFAWGTSSRSGKLVHGGLRYLKQGQIKTTFQSVRERQKLLNDYAGMIKPIGFLMPLYGSKRLESLMYKIGLSIYDAMAWKNNHHKYNLSAFSMQAPTLAKKNLQGGFQFFDAITDDARLVLRVIREGITSGGTALNYVSVTNLLKKNNRVCGVTVVPEGEETSMDIYGSVVINATGVWADELRSELDILPKLRKLRGSHLIFPHWRFPLAQAISFSHPKDDRSIYALPWEGVTLVGTTDMDHDSSLDMEPKISASEGKYLLEAIQSYLPDLKLSEKDVISTFAGIRPVIDTGKKDPSKEARDHAVWSDNGLVTVTGGKLTTFGILARDAMKSAYNWLPKNKKKEQKLNEVAYATKHWQVSEASRIFFKERYGIDFPAATDHSRAVEDEKILNTNVSWLELKWILMNEHVVHLEDVMLRRTRLGLTTDQGGFQLLHQIKEFVQSHLGWDDEKWNDEVSAYKHCWHSNYSPQLLKS